MVRTHGGLGVCVIVCTLLLPGVASAQQAQASGIAGVVRDTSGAVLPGVTVEASSPALIEKTRTVVTDTEGRYNIIDLRPGTYLVTFSLQGFNVFRRDGIELTSGFTATVNAEMQVGALTETITVTGESPLVDTRNARKQITVTDDLLNVLPSSVKNLNNLVTLTPGFRGNEGFDVTERTAVRSVGPSTEKVPPTSSSTAWASSTPPATRDTTRTPRRCRNSSCTRPASRPTATRTAPS